MNGAYFLIPILSILLIVSACRKDKDPVNDPSGTNEEELITTVRITLKDQSGANYSTAVFSDPDGEGGSGPVQIDTIRMQPGQIYDGSVELLDESKSPAEDLTTEVKEEATEHQFFYHPQGVELTISFADQDDNGLPVGIETKWTAEQTSAGTVKVVLKHQPDSKNNNESTGATDVEVTFPVVIK